MMLNKKAEVGTIILLILFIGAIYVINHPPKDNIIIIENGKVFQKDISTNNKELVVINKDDMEYILLIDKERLIINPNSKGYYSIGVGSYSYIIKSNPDIMGSITIKD